MTPLTGQQHLAQIRERLDDCSFRGIGDKQRQMNAIDKLQFLAESDIDWLLTEVKRLQGNTPITCAMDCGKTVGYITREEGDDFGEFYHCATCLDDRVDGICGDCKEVKLVREFTDGDPDAVYNTTVDYHLCETCEKERA